MEKNKEKIVCYNCGIELSEEIKTREHLPAQNLYEGFDDEFKNNRITVPACFDCNNMYSKIDGEIRDVVAVKSDDPTQLVELTGKGIRSIFRRKSWKDRIVIDANQNAISVDFNYSDLMQLHIKNYKALFYRKYRFPLPSDYSIEIVADGDSDEKLVQSAQVFLDYLFSNSKWEVSGHESIFKFIMKDITEGPDGNVYESGDFEKLVCIPAVLTYHNSVVAIVVAAKKDYLSTLPKVR